LATLDDITALSAIGVALSARIAALAQHSNGKPDDELLDAHEASAMLGISESYLYHAKKLPYAVKVGTRKKFSKQGIQKYITRQRGKA
jgi:predicted DNA-binding transcriptional regulator AlpA